jgi:leucyl aminopeptidase
MKHNHPISFLLIITGMTLFLTTCAKKGDLKKEVPTPIVEDPDTTKMGILTHKLTDEINADTLKSLVVWLEGMGTRYALADNHRDVAENIKRRFVMIGYPDTRLDSFMISNQQWQYNVIASLAGSANPDSICIIGAHYDDRLMYGDMNLIVPGANDNASGVAAAIELARVMKKNNYSPLNTIEFIAFADEEFGILGSKAYAGQAPRSAKKIKMMLNNDMIAYQPGTNPSDWVVNIMDYDNSHGFRKEAEQMCTRFTVLRFTNDNAISGMSDSFPFFSNGYKALFFQSNNFDPDYYHSLNDVSSHCNFEYCSEIVKISCALLVYNN